MKLIWEINDSDVDFVKSFVLSRMSNPFVRLRKRRNLEEPRPKVSKSTFWMAMVGCLLTTQQKSGPDTPVKNFLDTTPFPLNYETCSQRQDIEKFARDTLSSIRGIRRSPTIAHQIRINLESLESRLWTEVLELAQQLNTVYNPKAERHAAHVIKESLLGFGPKQSRNLLQWLGVSKYEIPIDSRITKWLNKNLLPFKLNANVLSDNTTYDLISDGIIELCARTEIFPCILDAAVFSSFDGSTWKQDNLSSEVFLGA